MTKTTITNIWKILQYRMNTEGLTNCFKYSKWDEINDIEFQKLKNQFIQISKELENYINTK